MRYSFGTPEFRSSSTSLVSCEHLALAPAESTGATSLTLKLDCGGMKLSSYPHPTYVAVLTACAYDRDNAGYCNITPYAKVGEIQILTERHRTQHQTTDKKIPPTPTQRRAGGPQNPSRLSLCCHDDHRAVREPRFYEVPSIKLYVPIVRFTM